VGFSETHGARLLLAAMVPFVFVAVFGVPIVVPQMLELRRLSRAGQVTRGEIVDTYPLNHNTCKYRFVAGRTYTGKGIHCGNAAIGQGVTVHFDPSDPSHSTNADPDREFINDLVFLVAALVCFAIVILASHGQRAWITAGHRFIEVAIGIAIGLVATAVWPERTDQA
jgi:hypothetical protein